MFILDTLLIGGLRFVLDKVVAAAEAESEDEGALRERLLEAQMRVETGEISDEEFAEIESGILARMRELRGAPPGGLSMSPDETIVGVEIESFESER